MTNDEIWFEALQHRELLVTVVGQERRKSNDFSSEELMSLGWEGMYKAVKNFDPERGENFDAFAQRVIRNVIADGVNKEYRQRGARVVRGEMVQAVWERSLDIFLQQLEWVDQDVNPSIPVRETRAYLGAVAYEDPDPFEVSELVKLRRAMLRLPTETLELLFDYYFSESEDRVRDRGSSGLTLRELAEKRGVSHVTMKRHLDEAHEFLRHQMEAMS